MNKYRLTYLAVITSICNISLLNAQESEVVELDRL